MLDGQGTVPGGTAGAELLHALRTLVARAGGFESVEVRSQPGAQSAQPAAADGTICVPFEAAGEQLMLTANYRDRPAPPADELARIADLCAMYARAAECLHEAALERHATLERIEYLQDHDPLTGLPHRNRFHARLSELLSMAKPLDSIAVLIVDTDRFRQVVDEHGPDAGDEVVAELAQRIRSAKNDEHELFRYRSDSFALIVHGPQSMTDVHYLAQRCISGVALPLKVDGQETRLTASVGIAIFPSDGHDVSALSIAATTAMRRAKRAGPGQFRFYNELLDERFGRRRLFAEELRDAVGKNQLVLYYQPIVGLQTRRVIGAEALLRWHHPRRGIVGATEFVHIAEESDLINEIGTWVLHHAAAQAKAWDDAGTPLVVAINLSARQFQDAGLLAETEGALKSSGVPPHLLEFEVTESIAMHDPDAAAYTLGCFRDLGLRVALDDFGTGHSSLAYLKRFPIDIIKLDQAFVAGLPDEPADAAIANAVVALASSMQCEVRAEGIELPAQEEYLRGIGVASAQGFLIAPPLMPHSFERWLQTFARTGTG